MYKYITNITYNMYCEIDILKKLDLYSGFF